MSNTLRKTPGIDFSHGKADTDIRNGDVEGLRNTMRNKGRPIRSTIIRDKNDNQVFYTVDKKGRARIDEVI